MKIKHLTRPFKIKAVEDDGTFEGYGSVFNVIDSYRDIVLPGAFTDSLKDHEEKDTQPALLWQHDSGKPMGVWDEIAEDDHGLIMKGRLALGTQLGKEAHELMKMGAVKGLSIGYRVPKGGEEYDEEHNVWNLREIDLWETSVVTFPANPSAQITDVRAALQDGIFPDVRDFEAFLTRDAGFSRSQARTILNEGYKSLVKQDAGDDLAAVNQKLDQLLER
jgi:hypothetical protein